MSRTGAIVPAAGRGERLGPGAPKALRHLGGSPLLVHAVKALAASRSVDSIVVVAPADDVDDTLTLLADVSGADIRVVAGGSTRTESVACGLVVLPDDVDVVLVHDAARPLVPLALIDAVASAVRAGASAVVPGIPVADTIKSIDADGNVTATLDRASLRAIQTPQGFDRATLVTAYSRATEAATDDAGLVEAIGVDVLVIPGDEEAFKITRPLDLVLAEAVLAQRRAAGVLG